MIPSVLARTALELAPVAPLSRGLFTRVTHAPPGVPAVYHGTSPDKARSILEHGFDLARTGENHAGSDAGARPYSVPGVYASTDAFTARSWGAFGNKIAPAAVQLLALHPRRDAHYVSMDVPEACQLSLAETRRFMAANPQAHEFRIAHGASTEVLFTRRAMEDPAVQVAYRLDTRAG